jgi:hypothetical protein
MKLLTSGGIIFIIGIFLLSCSVKPNEDARVIFIMGNAELIHKDGRNEAIDVKMKLVKGDIIKTKQGFVLVQIGDDILTRVQANTTVELTMLFEESGTRLDLSNGQIISHVRKLQKDKNYKIHTPTAIAAIRGTQYSISYYKERSVLAVREGIVQVDIPDMKKQTSVSEGNTLVINRGKTRNINMFESLEIEKISQIPFNQGKVLDTDEAYKSTAKIANEDEESLDKKIKDNGGPIPKTIEEMLQMYGYLNKVILYNNRYYVGIIKSRGNKIKILTLDGFETVPFKQIRNIKRLNNIVESQVREGI